MQVGLFEDHANCQSWAYKFVDWAYLSSARDWMQRGYPQALQLQLQCVNLQEKCIQIQLGFPMEEILFLSNFSIKMKYFIFLLLIIHDRSLIIFLVSFSQFHMLWN